MGIKDLWTILRPFGERKPLFELQGKTVAIDLSCWVCEAQNAVEHNKLTQHHIYLRNLYFRTCYLLLLGVKPVYVLEGKAPSLKYKTIAARNALQFKSKKPKDKKTKECKDRRHFNYTLRLCEEMLNCMGLVCLKGSGEAEAMCAYLNENKFVDGCITQDSDYFAYGGRVVYRNFSISQQGLYSANGGAVDEYNLKKLETTNGIGRNKIIAMALLCGSDYSDGVFGVGKDSVLKLFNEIPDCDILERLRDWRKNDDYYKNIEDKLLQVGRKNRKICICAKSIDDCRLCNSKDQQSLIKNELNIRKKSLELSDFPNEELIDEFLNNNQQPIKNRMMLKWQKPEITKFIEFTRKYLEWDEVYSWEKFLPIITRWQLMKNDQHRSDIICDDILKPDYIKKIRNPKGTPSYEIVWTDIGDIHKQLIPQEQLDSSDRIKLLSTIEPQNLVATAFPKLVEKYQQSKVKPIKKSRKRKTKAKSSDSNLDGQTNILMSLKATVKKVPEEPISNDSSEDDFDPDLSDIIEDIINYKKPKYINENLNKIRREMKIQEESHFFAISHTEIDLFEATFTNLTDSGSNNTDYSSE